MEIVDGFVPHQVGLDGLQEDLQRYDTKDWDDDHQIHEMDVYGDMVPTKEEPTLELTMQELYDNFMNVTSWDNSPVGHILIKNLNN